MRTVIYAGVLVIACALSAAGGWIASLGYAYSQAQAQIDQAQAQVAEITDKMALTQAELEASKAQYDSLRERTAEILRNEEVRTERVNAAKSVAKDAAAAGAKSLWDRVTGSEEGQ